MSARAGERGQASVELVALLPVCALLLACCWQLALAGHATWAAAAAARSSARAAAVRGVEEGERAALRALPLRLRRGASIDIEDDGRARVAVRVPAVVLRRPLLTIERSATFAPQR